MKSESREIARVYSHSPLCFLTHSTHAKVGTRLVHQPAAPSGSSTVDDVESLSDEAFAEEDPLEDGADTFAKDDPLADDVGDPLSLSDEMFT